MARSTSPESSTSHGSSISLYLLRGNYLGVAHRSIASTPAVATQALNALLAGPALSERQAGLSTAIPGGSRLLDLRVSSGTAIANLNAEFAAPGAPASELQRVAQVMYTLTQFSSVARVAIEINGVTPAKFGSGSVNVTRALGCSDVLGALPAIMVESPAVGDVLGGSLHLTGLANVFEAQFRTQLTDNSGRLLVDEPVHATAGSGTWGSFDVTFRFAGSATSECTLRVYAVSMKDGSPIDEVDLRLPARS